MRSELSSGEAPNDITWRDGADPEAIAEELEKLSGRHWRSGNIDRSTMLRDAAYLIRELADRIPPFDLTWRTPRVGPDAGRTTVEIAGCTITRPGQHVVFSKPPYKALSDIYRACEADHE